jgi:glycosyltransferase involved in cell wall biosynthesis
LAVLTQQQDAPPAAAPLGLPAVSVIVPTRNRAGWLAFLFHALALQVYPSELIEVLIVDNSSTDDTDEVVRRWAQSLPFPLHFHRKANEGPASSRNYGAARATGEVLAFTDSDCIPEPGWLLNGVRALKDGEIGLVTGPIIPRRTADTHFFFNAQMGPVLSDNGLYRTASLLVPRRLFLAVGGFDEAFGLGPGGALLGGEDTDLGWRIKRTGQRAAFRPDVMVTHLATPISRRDWLLRPVLSQTIPRLVRAHPELRKTMLWHRYFHKETDLFFLLGLAGVAAAVALHWWPLALLPLGYVWSVRHSLAGMVRKGRLDKAAAVLGLLAVQTGINVAVLAYASVRHRRLVL